MWIFYGSYGVYAAVMGYTCTWQPFSTHHIDLVTATEALVNGMALREGVTATLSNPLARILNYYYYYYRSYIAHNTFGKVSMHFRGKIKTENLNN